MLQKLAKLTLALTLLSACQGPLEPLFGSLSTGGRSYSLIPEYEPVQGLIVSEHLASFGNGHQLLSTLLGAGAEIWMLNQDQNILNQTRSQLTERFGVKAEDLNLLKSIPIETQSVWARDWAPLFSYSSSGGYGLVDYQYYADRPIDDAVPAKLASFLRGSGLSRGQTLQNLPIDVEIEGGNVMCTATNCFVSREVLKRLEERGETPNAAAIKAELEKYFSQTFWIVPRLPFESTGHIDIWAKFLNDKTVIIGEISEESLAAVPDDQKETYRQVRLFLEEQATGMTADGQPASDSLAAVLKRVHPEITIQRLPMPTPGIYRGVETFRTYTNSVLYNGIAIVPQYLRGNRAVPSERELTTLHEREVEKIYKQAGYQVVWIRADNLIRDGGAWHCVVMQIPRLDAQRQTTIAAPLVSQTN